MESLGGDQYWVDRFLAQHAAVFYYWTVVGFFALSPSNAYTFSELVEARARRRGGPPAPAHARGPEAKLLWHKDMLLEAMQMSVPGSLGLTSLCIRQAGTIWS